MDGTHAIGVDVGGTKTRAGVVSRDGEVARRHESMTPIDSQEALLEGMEAAVASVREDGVAAVGFGLPAPIDQRSGRVVQAVNIPLADVELRELLRERIGLPVALANDAQAAAIGEWRAGAGRGATDLVMLTLGTGVVGGGFGSAAWEYLLPPAEEVMRREALRPGRDQVQIVRAALGTASGLIGAAFVGFEALDSS